MKIKFHDFEELKICPDQHGFLCALQTTNSYKIVYYKSGSGQIMLGSSLCRFSPEMFAFVKPGKRIRSAVTAETEQWACEFTVDADVGNIGSGLYRDRDSGIFRQLQQIHREYRQQDPYRKEFLDLYSTELFYSVLRSIRDSASKATTVTEIINYIDEYYCDSLRIENLARKTGYTCRHFRSLFTRFAGMPPSEYLLRCRIEGAKKLLRTTSMNMIEISQACGFSSSSQFAVQFRRDTGMTPSGFRNSAWRHGNSAEERLFCLMDPD